MQYPIKIDGLTKRYGALTALDGVSFEVGKGELFGLIGPDGAGKTTLFRLLTTLMKPDEGSATVDGFGNLQVNLLLGLLFTLLLLFCLLGVVAGMGVDLGDVLQS